MIGKLYHHHRRRGVSRHQAVLWAMDELVAWIYVRKVRR